jgi:hypothetical protein
MKKVAKKVAKKEAPKVAPKVEAPKNAPIAQPAVKDTLPTSETIANYMAGKTVKNVAYFETFNDPKERATRRNGMFHDVHCLSIDIVDDGDKKHLLFYLPYQGKLRESKISAANGAVKETVAKAPAKEPKKVTDLAKAEPIVPEKVEKKAAKGAAIKAVPLAPAKAVAPKPPVRTMPLSGAAASAYLKSLNA